MPLDPMEITPSLTPNEFKELVVRLYDEFDEVFHDAVVAFANRVLYELGDCCYSAQMFHILIGSTPDSRVVELDLEGEFSALRFVCDFIRTSQVIACSD